jgi:hypothetical protein
MYSRSAWGKVFEGVFIERKEGEAVAEFKGRGVIVKGVKRESSFEGSSCGVGTLGFLNHTFFNHTDGRHALTLVGTKHCVARKFPFEASKLVQGDGAAHGIQIRTGHGALETTARRHSCIVGVVVGVKGDLLFCGGIPRMQECTNAGRKNICEFKEQIHRNSSGLLYSFCYTKIPFDSFFMRIIALLFLTYT